MHTKRARLTAFVGIAALLGGVTMAAAVGTFTDLDDDRYYTDAVSWAANNGIVEGTSATTFSPDDAMTRGQGVTILHRYNESIVDALETSVDALETSVDALETSVEALGGMHFELIREHMQADGLEGYGTAKTLLTVDGVSLKIQCYSGDWLGVPEDSAPAGEATGNDLIGFWLWFESVDDGWYSGWEDTEGPVETIYAPDDYVYGVDETEYGPAYPWDYSYMFDVSHLDYEDLDYDYGEFSAITPNGGYIAVVGATYILNSSVRDNDCEVYGVVNWAEPPATED
jgi:hypothetical protein